MKRYLLITICTIILPTLAYAEDSYNARDTYVGVRVHKNDSIAFMMEPDNGDGVTLRDDGFGVGLTIGNRLTQNVKIEFETAYTNGKDSDVGNDFEFHVWSNMLNVYVYQQFGGAVEPYVGFGIGVSGLWGKSHGLYDLSDATADLSWSLMLGVNFALNDYIDLNLGLKYQNYGDMDMTNDAGYHNYTEIDATEIYIGAAYKFGL